MMRVVVAAMIAGLLAACAGVALETPARALLDRMTQATVGIHSRAGRGGGVLVGRRMVLTAGHVVGSSITTVVVTFEDGSMSPGERVFFSKNPDVALIRLDRDAPFPPAAVACGALDLDAPIIVVAHPGLMRWFVNHGRVASTHPAFGASVSQIALAVPVVFGSSGGPVFDRRGRIRGLIRAGLTRRGIPTPGFTMAVPSTAFCRLPKISAEIASVPS